MADGSLLFDTKFDASGFTKGLGTLGSAAGAALKGTGIAISAVSAAVAGLTVSAVKAYSDYEQLTGGVETLFKSSSDEVLSYAKEAYKTAGMSANAYMETVTSFSASLLQSLGGDTAAAAAEADKAITDMSDNANKMGTDIGLIQNAYQGFAKQNYTMLDNLKLGYGGTKEEMQRLLEDATTLSGIEYDLSSYADIVDAIHVVQDNLGITGTTAKEASTTIQGSIASMSAAWTNFLTGMSDPEQDFDELLDNLVDSVMTVADNLAPRLIETVPRLVEGLAQVATTLSGYLPDMFQELLPVVLDGASALLKSLVSAMPGLLKIISEIAPDLVSTAIEILGLLGQALIDNAPLLLKSMQKIVSVVLSSIAEIFPELSPLTDLIGFLVSNLDKLMPIIVGVVAAFATYEAVAKAVAIAQALMNLAMNLNPIGIIVTLIAALVAAFIYLWNTSDEFRQFWIDLWENITSFFSECWNGIVAFFTETIPQLIQSIIDWFNQLPEMLMQWGQNIYDTVTTAISDMISNVITFFSELPGKIAYWIGFALGSIIQWGVDLVTWAATAIPEFIDSIETFFSELPGKILAWLVDVITKIVEWKVSMVQKAIEIGMEFVQKVIEFFSQLPEKAWKWLLGTISKIISFRENIKTKAKEAATGFITNIIDGLSGLPDKMVEIGANIVSGIWQGIQNGWTWLVDSVKNLADSLFQGAKDALDIHSPSKKFKWIGQMCVEGMDEPLADYNPYETLSKSMSANKATMRANFLGSSDGYTNSTNTTTQTFNIYQPVKSPSEMMRAARLEQQFGMAGA